MNHIKQIEISQNIFWPKNFILKSLILNSYIINVDCTLVHIPESYYVTEKTGKMLQVIWFDFGFDWNILKLVAFNKWNIKWFLFPIVTATDAEDTANLGYIGFTSSYYKEYFLRFGHPIIRYELGLFISKHYVSLYFSLDCTLIFHIFFRDNCSPTEPQS